MQRRTFIKESGMVALSLGVFGDIHWDKDRFVGDTPTTTDILGPFYRPGAPFQTDMNPEGFAGEILHLSGTILKSDGKTPFKDGLIEVWQCDEKQVYDNTSDDFRYRASQRISASGKYHFITTQPVGYPAAPNSDVYRPAHIHLRISGEEQQDLITQIYIKGDSYNEKDPCASSPTAANRILEVTNNKNNEKVIHFNVVMAKEFKPEDAVFKKLSGLYRMNDNSLIEFYKEGDLLMMKWNGQIREGFWYKGDNEFRGGIKNKVNFQLLANGEMKVKIYFITVLKKEFNLEGTKIFKYEY
jgi:protocatechuate 3,4-dioxygenase beta subunit